MEKQRVTNTVPLPEHLGERGVAVIRPGGRRGAGGVVQEKERVNHAKERQKGYWQRVKRRGDCKKGLDIKKTANWQESQFLVRQFAMKWSSSVY